MARRAPCARPRRLGLDGGSNQPTLKGHSLRLGLATEHLTPARSSAAAAAAAPDLGNLRRAGPMLAAAWFTLVGCDVSWPLEPCRYDLVVWMPNGAERIQVKTTTSRSGGSWVAKIASSGSAAPYDPAELDSFFVIDGEMSCYLIPVHVVGGLRAIQLSAYADRRIASAASLLSDI